MINDVISTFTFPSLGTEICESDVAQCGCSSSDNRFSSDSRAGMATACSRWRFDVREQVRGSPQCGISIRLMTAQGQQRRLAGYRRSVWLYSMSRLRLLFPIPLVKY